MKKKKKIKPKRHSKRPAASSSSSEENNRSTASSALDDLERGLAIIRDRVRGVGLHLHNGFYLFGRPGTSKSHTVVKTLEAHGIRFELHKGHLAPIGLFELLAMHHDRVIVLDDEANTFANKTALKILLAALGNEPSDSAARILKYRRQGRDEVVRFTGGIIAISNLELSTNSLLAATQEPTFLRQA